MAVGKFQFWNWTMPPASDESVGICRYFEAVHPEPSLFGRRPVEMGRIEMRNRHLEFELLGPIGVSWRNGTIVDTHVQV